MREMGWMIVEVTERGGGKKSIEVCRYSSLIFVDQSAQELLVAYHVRIRRMPFSVLGVNRIIGR